jgi:hypothetical protein
MTNRCEPATGIGLPNTHDTSSIPRNESGAIVLPLEQGNCGFVHSVVLALDALPQAPQ